MVLKYNDMFLGVPHKIMTTQQVVRQCDNMTFGQILIFWKKTGVLCSLELIYHFRHIDDFFVHQLRIDWQG